MEIDKDIFMERYYVPDEWYDKDGEVKANAPDDIKKRADALTYIYGNMPYEGYVFPYDDIGDRSSYSAGDVTEEDK